MGEITSGETMILNTFPVYYAMQIIEVCRH